MANPLPIPPTYAEPVLVDERTKKATFNPIWLNWFLNFAQLLQQSSTGSTANHENLQNLQGGVVNQHYHFTSAEHTLIAAFSHQGLNNLQGGNGTTEFYHFTNAEHTLLQAFNHESLNGLLGGAANDHNHLTAAQRTTVISGPAQAVTNIVVGASPFTWQNTTGFNVLVVAAGGTAVTYSLSRDNVTFFAVGTPTIIPVVRGDFLKVTYTAAPTLNYFAM